MADDKTFTKADVDAAIEAAVAKAQESVDKLEAKNEELIGENRTLKRGREVKPEDLQAAEDRADKAEKDLAEAQKSVKTLTTERDKAVKALEGEQGFTNKLLVQDGLKSALIANGVKDETFIDALTAKFSGQASVTLEGDARKAMIGDKSLEDAVKEFAASDAGKKFVSAPNNGGGGAGGGKDQKSNATTMTRSAFNALGQADQAALGPQMAKGELKLVDDGA